MLRSDALILRPPCRRWFDVVSGGASQCVVEQLDRHGPLEAQHPSALIKMALEGDASAVGIFNGHAWDELFGVSFFIFMVARCCIHVFITPLPSVFYSLYLFIVYERPGDSECHCATGLRCSMLRHFARYGLFI